MRQAEPWRSRAPSLAPGRSRLRHALLKRAQRRRLVDGKKRSQQQHTPHSATGGGGRSLAGATPSGERGRDLSTSRTTDDNETFE